jgi:inactivated superfamily I helicase
MEQGGMRDLRARAATAGAALAGVLAFTGCTDPAEADTTAVVSAVEEVPGVDDAIVGLRWDGLPTDRNVALGMTVSAPGASQDDPAALTALMEGVLAAAWENTPIRPAYAIELVVTTGAIPEDATPGGIDTADTVIIADAISAALGGEPDGRELRATPAALEARFGPWEKP